MSYTVIDLGNGQSASGQYGDFVCLDMPEEVRDAANAGKLYVPMMLRWINGLARMGLDFHGVDVMGNCFFKIVAVGAVARG